MKKRPFALRYFKCPECGAIQTATKKLSLMSEKGHIKTMYCFSCKKKRQFEMIDAEFGR